MTLADKILAFNDALDLSDTKLPDGIRAMNPFREGDTKVIKRVTKQFYTQFYNDSNQRKFIIGINPGRLGAGLTGVPFSDTKRLLSDCDIEVNEFSTHEPSSVFVYDVIRAYGGAAQFYSDFYINSVSPLGFVKLNDKGRELNYNYYDQADLTEAVTPFILKTLTAQIEMGLDTETVWVMGGGKNFKFLKKFNEKHQLFGRILPLDHPRYIVQYKSKYTQDYIEKYLKSFQEGK